TPASGVEEGRRRGDPVPAPHKAGCGHRLGLSPQRRRVRVVSGWHDGPHALPMLPRVAVFRNRLPCAGNGPTSPARTPRGALGGGGRRPVAGRIVLAVIPDPGSGEYERTLKRVRVGAQSVTLEAANPDYAPIPLGEGRIVGVAVALRRAL